MNQNKEPCENCILLPMCVNKTSTDLIDGCVLLSNYIVEKTNIKGLKDKAPTEVSCVITSLRREFLLGVDSWGEAYFNDY
jgi:hypothetical protein